MFEIGVNGQFSSAHYLKGYKGKCEARHGHNWGVEVYVSGDELDEQGLLLDFTELKKVMNETLDELDHTELNELDMFADINPSSENIARIIFHKIAEALDCPRYKVSRVVVYETPGSRATYSG